MMFVTAIQWLAAVLAYAVLAFMFYGIWRGTQRRAGRMVGRAARWLGVPWFYLVSTLLFLGISYAGWIPATRSPSAQGQFWMCLAGALLYFPGMALTVWGRLVLGQNYLPSMLIGVRLFQNQQLITTGPFALVRHPMYLGLMLATLGSALIYLTWTTIGFAACAPFLLLRARMEERALAAEFGEGWQQYRRRVPMLIPRVFSSSGLVSHGEKP